MNIEELKDKHEEIETEGNVEWSLVYNKHTKLSIEFAIEVLEDTDQKIMNLTGNSLEYYNLYYGVIEPKIQELKQYLDDK